MTMRKALIAAATAAVLLSGCAERYAAVKAVTEVGINQAETVFDDKIQLERRVFCANPYSAMVRNAAEDQSLKKMIREGCGEL